MNSYQHSVYKICVQIYLFSSIWHQVTHNLYLCAGGDTRRSLTYRKTYTFFVKFWNYVFYSFIREQLLQFRINPFAGCVHQCDVISVSYESFISVASYSMWTGWMCSGWAGHSSHPSRMSNAVNTLLLIFRYMLYQYFSERTIFW